MTANKTLKIYKEDGDFVIERVNQFNHATKRYFMSEDGLREGLNAYWLDMDDYKLEVNEDLQTLVNHLLDK